VRAAAVLLAVLLLLAGCGGGKERPRAPDVPATVTQLESREDLRPPAVAFDVPARRPGDELILVSPRMEEAERDAATHQQGALALDQQGRVRWFHVAPDGEPILDVKVQRYQGRPVLTWWEGAASQLGVGRGQGVIVDSSYRRIATIRAGNGLSADLHEVLLTPRGTAWLTIYSRARRDLRPLGGAADAQVTEGVVQEVDVATGRVLFEWHSLDEIDPSESYMKPQEDQESFDYFHINSVEELEDGDILVSARHTSAVYRIDRETKRIVWRLGGKRGDFEMGEGTDFGLQHDARDLGDGVVQIFDNAAEDERDQTPSSVKRLRLDEEEMTARLVQRFDQPDGMWAQSQGNAQALRDGGVMAGWGSTGAFSRFDREGDLVFDAHLPAEYDSYRAHLARWVGTPATTPAIRAKREGDQVTVAASWNGSTEVERWQVLAGESPQALRPVGGPAAWNGLETRIVRATAAPYVAVAALDGDGKTLRTSRAARP
jgi:hypothetical protein